MSLMLQQRTSAQTAAPKQPGERGTRSGFSSVAGVPLLLRLPDLSPGAQDRTTAQHVTQAAVSSGSSAAGGRDDAKSSTPEPDHNPGSSAGARAFFKNRISRSTWHNSLWHLLIPISLLCLLLVVWAVMSAPSTEETKPTGGAEIVTPDIEGGELVSPDELVLPEVQPPPATEDTAREQLTEVAPSPTDPDETDMTPAGDETMDTESRNAPGAAGPQWIGTKSGSFPAQGHGATPEAMQPGRNASSADGPTGRNVEGQAARPSFNYPPTDPTTYHYSNDSNEGFAPRVGQRPGDPSFHYPSTGAPPLGASGAVPGVERR